MLSAFDQTLFHTPTTLESSSTIFLDIQLLQSFKESYKSEDENAVTTYEYLIHTADSILSLSPTSVINKNEPAPSGSFNDYVSLAPYWWPDPDSVNGPYIRRDGRVNPDISLYNRDELSDMRSGVLVLAVAYYLSDNETYADKAIDYLDTWFVQPSTRMNPHLRYAQFVPGVNDGRFIGIIEGIDFARVLDAVFLLKTSNVWSPGVEKGLARWYSDFFDWLTNSYMGMQEKNYINNHGSWYDVQVLTYANALHKQDSVYSTLENSIEKRIEAHIAADGSQPHEIERTRSLHYSVYNLQALLIIAEFGQLYDVDIWNYPFTGNSKLQTAVDFLIPYITGESKWPYDQVQDYDTCNFLDILDRAYALSDDEKYETIRQTLISGGCAPHSVLY